MIWRTKTCVILTVWDNFFLELSISCTVWPKKNGLTDAAEEIHEAARFLSFYARFTAFLPLLPLSLRFVCRAGEITLHISGDLRNCLMAPAGQKWTIIKITPKKGIEICTMRSEHHHKMCLLLAQKSLTHCRIGFCFDHFRISSKGAFYRSLIPIWRTAESSEDQNATLWGNSKQRIWLVFPTWIAKFRSDVFIICCDSFELLRIWYATLWDQFLTVPISNMRALSCYLKCWESLPKQSDQVITFDQQVKLTFSWWCSRILFAFKSTIVASKVKRQIMNSIRSNVAEYWVDHKYWKHHKAIKRKSSQHPRFISTFYESRTNAKDFKNEGDFQVAMN